MENTMNRGMTDTSSNTSSMQGEIDSLKESFGKLRSDVAELFSHAFGFGRSGANMARDYGADTLESVKSRFNDLRDRGTKQMHAFEYRVGEKPLTSAFIAFGVGFLLAKVLHHKD